MDRFLSNASLSGLTRQSPVGSLAGDALGGVLGAQMFGAIFDIDPFTDFLPEGNPASQTVSAPSPDSEGAAFAGDAAYEGADSQGATCTLVPANSFSGDTPVETDHGEVPIDKIKVGDKVLSYDDGTGKNGYYPVTAVMVHLDMKMQDVTIDGEQVETTPEHPFFTQERGWVEAGDLKVGEHVRKADGSFGMVKANTARMHGQEMYNLTVEKAHTFFVGIEQWLVHNTSEDCTEDEHAQESYKRYVERGGQKDFDEWNRRYFLPRDKTSLSGLKVKAVHDELGWGSTNVNVYPEPGVTRQLDIADAEGLRGVEVKSYTSRPVSLADDQGNVRIEVANDAKLVQQNWNITWVFTDQPPNGPLSKALVAAGIKIQMFKLKP